MIRKFFSAFYAEFAEIQFAAASIAYSTLLSIVPFLIVALAIFQSGVGLEALYPKIEQLFTTYLKEATGTLAVDYIKTILSNVHARTFGATGIILLMFTSVNLIRSIDTAFHRIWKIKMIKPAIGRIWFYWFILLLTPVGLAVLVGLRSINYFNRFNENLESQFFISLWLTLFLWLLYTFIPHIKVKLAAALPSAILTSIALNLVQNGFIWASLTVFRKNKIYGSLASFPIFLLWLLVVWCVILWGVSLCSFLQQKILKRS